MDPINQDIAPVPSSPPAAPGIPAAPVEGQLSQEEMKANLQAMMAKIDDKYQDFNSQKFAVDNEVQKSKSDTLAYLFDLFESKGVDPNDPAAVKAFLDKIKEGNPELFQQVEQALQALLGDGSEVSPEETPEALPSEDMNINTNEVPQENI